jgi:hypothetical protein
VPGAPPEDLAPGPPGADFRPGVPAADVGPDPAFEAEIPEPAVEDLSLDVVADRATPAREGGRLLTEGASEGALLDDGNELSGVAAEESGGATLDKVTRAASELMFESDEDVAGAVLAVAADVASFEAVEIGGGSVECGGLVAHPPMTIDIEM